MKFYDDITSFLFLEDTPALSDVIFIPGSLQTELPVKAAALYHEGYAPYILPSGRFSKIAGKCALDGYETEWEFMYGILRREGVPKEAVLKEDRATFTWENAIFSRQLLEEKGIPVNQAIVCCQAFHARRAYTYYQQQFPQVRLLMAPVVTRGISRDNWFLDKEKASVVLGELDRCGDQFRCLSPEQDPIGWG